MKLASNLIKKEVKGEVFNKLHRRHGVWVKVVGLVSKKTANALARLQGLVQDPTPILEEPLAHVFDVVYSRTETFPALRGSSRAWPKLGEEA
jgi:hypothetical protein